MHRFLAFAALAATAGLHAETDPLDTIEQSTAAWIDLRAETVRLATAWQTEQSLLDSTLVALEERATAAEEELELERAKSLTEREEIAALAEKVKTGMADQRAFETRLLELNANLLRLRPFHPPRLSDALEVSITSLSDSELPPGERVQLTVSVLNRCMQFSRTVTATDEVLRLDDAPEGKMFEVIYWGASHAYAVDRTTGKAWYGAPGTSGWTWEAREDLVESALRLIAIFKDDHDPEFVLAPARLTRLSTKEPSP